MENSWSMKSSTPWQMGDNEKILRIKTGIKTWWTVVRLMFEDHFGALIEIDRRFEEKRKENTFFKRFIIRYSDDLELQRKEKALFKSIERESIIYRGIPLGIMTAVFYDWILVKVLKTNPALRPIPGFTGLILGTLFGGLTYTPIGQERILNELPEESPVRQRVAKTLGRETKKKPVTCETDPPSPETDAKLCEENISEIELKDNTTKQFGINEYGDPIFNFHLFELKDTTTKKVGINEYGDTIFIDHLSKIELKDTTTKKVGINEYGDPIFRDDN